MKLFFREKGNLTLPPLILLHGLWGASDNWLPIAGLLAEYFHIFLPDLRNHGHSPHAPEHNYDVLAKDIEEFITSLQLSQKPFIAGHSMGGKALMVLLLKRPEIAQKAVIIDITPSSYNNSIEQNIHSRLLNFIQATSFDTCNREMIQAIIHKAFPEEEYYQLLLKNIRKGENGFEWKINTLALQENLADLMDWRNVPGQTPYRFPILFIRGENSDYIPASLTTNTLALFPAASLVTIPGASHRIHADQPQMLAETLRNYFQTNISVK